MSHKREHTEQSLEYSCLPISSCLQKLAKFLLRYFHFYHSRLPLITLLTGSISSCEFHSDKSFSFIPHPLHLNLTMFNLIQITQFYTSLYCPRTNLTFSLDFYLLWKQRVFKTHLNLLAVIDLSYKTQTCLCFIWA